MSYVTLEVDIDRGQVVPREPGKLPEKGSGLLTILPASPVGITGSQTPRRRVHLPLIKGDGERIVNPLPEELDASLWDD
jgi:hypothetical protein